MARSRAANAVSRGCAAIHADLAETGSCRRDADRASPSGGVPGRPKVGVYPASAWLVSAEDGVGVDGAEAQVLGMVDGLVDELGDVVVVERIDDVSALALPVDQTEVA